MSRTVTAFFDSRSEAEAARTRLSSSRIDADNVKIIDQSTSGQGSSGQSGSGSHSSGFFGSLKELFLPDEDAHAYGEGISRGGFLLCAQVDEDQADEAIRLLEESDSVDFDQREEEWRSSGWQGFSGMTDTGVPSGAGMGGSGLTSGMGSTAAGGFDSSSTSGDYDRSAATAGAFDNQERSRTVDEEHIPIVEEELRVGKREVNRGGARVRSYVREVPVHESVSLREEHVSVERRPVDQKLSGTDLQGGDLLRERNIEMTETAEEAVVAKEARVREELVVKKTSEEHVENIDETVRRTEVEVDEGLGGTGERDRSAFGFQEGSTGSGLDRDGERGLGDRSGTDFEQSGKTRY